MAAMVAAALAAIGDRLAWLTAILADRYRRPAPVLVAAALAVLAASALASVGGALLAPRLTPEAKLLMLALACGFQGAGVFGRVKPPERLAGWRLGGFLTALIGLFILAFGDGAQFIVVTLAARTTLPWLAAVGATIGTVAVLTPAALLGEAAWLALPLRGLRIAAGAAFLITGVVLALQALRLV